MILGLIWLPSFVCKPQNDSLVWIDLSTQLNRQIIVDKQEGQYLGHPTTYGHWTEGESPHVVSIRFTLKEIDQMSSDEIH